jgi:uncharacterized membrane protein YcaP (DUF421 family)
MSALTTFIVEQLMTEPLKSILGIGVQPQDFTILQVCARAVVVLIAAMVMVKLAHKRFMAKKTAFEYVIAFVIASMLSRAINGSAPLFPSIAGGFVVVGAQWLAAILSFHSKLWGRLVKGNPIVLVEKGVPNHANMVHSHISEDDLKEDLRLNGKTEDFKTVRFAQLERNGDISVLREPRVVLLKVENGVQFVELHIEA